MTMQSRRDLFQAHRLMTQRAALALLRGEPDVPDQPLRRVNVATFLGLLLAVIAVAGFGIWGLLFKGGAALKFQPGQSTLIIDKQTGTNYVFCGKHDQNICPMVNHASGLLALKSSTVNVEPVNQSSLTSIPHGPELGIAGLPDLPGPSLLITQPWSVCTQTLSNVPGIGTETIAKVAGGIPTGSQPLGSQGLLVSVPGQNQDWIILNGQRLPIFNDTRTAEYPEAQVVPVPLAWLNSIPQSPSSFQAPSITNRGATVTSPTGAKVNVGQLYQESGTANDFVTLEGGKLAPITPLQDQLLSILPGAPPQQQLPANALLPGDVVGKLSQPGLPATKPTISAAVAPAPFCVVYSGSGPRLTSQIETGGRMPPAGTSTGVRVNTPDAALVNDVVLPPGKGALVRETGDNVSYFLVTGGHKYALASRRVPSYLGYSTSQAVQLPASVMDLIPTGPPFNPSRANDAASS